MKRLTDELNKKMPAVPVLPNYAGNSGERTFPFLRLAKTDVSIAAAALPEELKRAVVLRYNANNYVPGYATRENALGEALDDIVAARALINQAVHFAEPQIRVHLCDRTTAYVGLEMLGHLVQAYSAVHSPSETQELIERYRAFDPSLFKETEKGQRLMGRWVSLAITPVREDDIDSVNFISNPTHVLGRQEKPGFYFDALQYATAVAYVITNQVEMDPQFYKTARETLERGMETIASFILSKTNKYVELSNRIKNETGSVRLISSLELLREIIEENNDDIVRRNVTEEELASYRCHYQIMHDAYMHVGGAPVIKRVSSRLEAGHHANSKEGLNIEYFVRQDGINFGIIRNYHDVRFYSDDDTNNLNTRHPSGVIFSPQLKESDLLPVVAPLVEFATYIGEIVGISAGDYDIITQLIDGEFKRRRIDIKCYQSPQLRKRAVEAGYLRERRIGQRTVYFPTQEAIFDKGMETLDYGLGLHTGVQFVTSGHRKLPDWAGD